MKAKIIPYFQNLPVVAGFLLACSDLSHSLAWITAGSVLGGLLIRWTRGCQPRYAETWGVTALHMVNLLQAAFLGLVYYQLTHSFLLDVVVGSGIGFIVSRLQARTDTAALERSPALWLGFIALFAAVRLMLGWPLKIGIPVGTLSVNVIIAWIDRYL